MCVRVCGTVAHILQSALTSAGRFYAATSPLPLSLPLCLQLEVGLRVAMHQRAVSMFVPKIKSMCPVLCAASERASVQLCVCVEIYNRKSATVKKQCCAKRAARATLSLFVSLSLSLSLLVLRLSPVEVNQLLLPRCAAPNWATF